MTCVARRSLPTTALLGLALACGPGSGEGEPVAEGELVPAIADVVCDLQSECDCEMPLPADQCRDVLTDALELFFGPPVDSGLSYDAACAMGALALYEDLGCGTIDDVVEDADCNGCKVWYGPKQRGDACSTLEESFFDDCDQGLICVEGTCVDPCETADEGEPCLGVSCGDGLVCRTSFDPDTEEVSSECVPAARLGESCMELSCEDELECDGETFECVAPPAEGEPCEWVCAGDNWCDTSSPDGEGVCRAPQPDGTACIADDECSSGECDDESETCAPQIPLVCEISA
jgi:hypothetical protein